MIHGKVIGTHWHRQFWLSSILNKLLFSLEVTNLTLYVTKMKYSWVNALGRSQVSQSLGNITRSAYSCNIRWLTDKT